MLSQHEFYVYHQAEIVYGRMGDRERVVIEVCESPQAAYEKVQSIINPENLPASHFKEERTDKNGVTQIVEVGYHSKEFQDKISQNCESVVKTAYGLQG